MISQINAQVTLITVCSRCWSIRCFWDTNHELWKTRSSFRRFLRFADSKPPFHKDECPPRCRGCGGCRGCRASFSSKYVSVFFFRNFPLEICLTRSGIHGGFRISVFSYFYIYTLLKTQRAAFWRWFDSTFYESSSVVIIIISTLYASSKTWTCYSTSLIESDFVYLLICMMQSLIYMSNYENLSWSYYDFIPS